jgi:hypothetical protein
MDRLMPHRLDSRRLSRRVVFGQAVLTQVFFFCSPSPSTSAEPISLSGALVRLEVDSIIQCIGESLCKPCL